MVNDVIKDSQLAVNVISLVNGLHVFFNVPKLREVYVTKHAEEYPSREVKFLAAQIEIRWGCKFEAIDLLVCKLKLFLDCLLTIANNRTRDFESKHKDQAAGYYLRMVSGRFIVSLVTLHMFLN